MNWDLADKHQLNESETIMLSRDDNMRANYMNGKVDLMGYKHDNSMEIKLSEEH